MKKVLALILALSMLMTMAFAAGPLTQQRTCVLSTLFDISGCAHALLPGSLTLM